MTLRTPVSSLAARALCAGAVALALAGSALAQAPARPAGGAPAGPLPAGRIAIINVAAFQEKVLELKRAIDGLNSKFEPRAKDLQALGDQIASIENQVKAGGVAPNQQAQLSERYEQLKRDYTRKREDLSAEAQKAYSTSADPIRDKLSKALDAYAASHGIVLVIEIGGAIKAGSIFYAAENTNITDDFIATYNKTNP